MNIELKATALADIVCSHRLDWTAARVCCDALKRYKSEVLRALSVDAEQIKRIYDRRLRNVATSDTHPVLGADRLLSDLAAYDGSTLLMVAWEDEAGVVFCMLVDDAATRLIACFVGTDRRFASVA
jgi:hypothetical protein